MATESTKPNTRDELAEAFSPLELAALALELVDEHYTRAQRAVDAAKERRDEIRAQFRAFFPVGVDVEIDEIAASLRRDIGAGGRTFSLTRYEAQHEITAEMEPFIGRRSGAERWTRVPL